MGLARLSVLALAPVLLGTACGSSPEPPVGDASVDGEVDPRIAAFLATATSIVHQRGIVGAGIALVLDGKLVFADGIGVRSVGGRPVDGDTLFVIGSTTKMMTAATVLSLVQEGRVDLHAPVTTYLPKLTVNAPFDVHDVTLDKLLSHSDALEDTNAAQCAAFSRFSQYGAAAPVTLWGPPGAFFDYSNNDMVLAAAVVESILGDGTFEQAVHDRVFVPAGMSTATFDIGSAIGTGDFTVGYLADPTGAFTVGVPLAEVVKSCPVLEPAGLALASARDLGDLIVTFLADGGTMLRPESVAQMETGVIATGGAPNYDEEYGYALLVDHVGGETIINHGGDVPPFHSIVGFVPSTKFGFAMLVNSDAPSALQEVAYAAIQAFSPPPSAPEQPVVVPESAWGAYEGPYVDSYGTLGAFMVADQGGALTVTATDGGAMGTLAEVNGDQWVLTPGDASTQAPFVGVFWRNDAGAVERIVTRRGVADRVDAGTESDASGD